jgi:hypothetical protein
MLMVLKSLFFQVKRRSRKKTKWPRINNQKR